jgi:hypothetical protein
VSCQSRRSCSGSRWPSLFQSPSQSTSSHGEIGSEPRRNHANHESSALARV